MKSDKIRFALIGCGHIGGRHVEMIRNNPRCELTAICDLHPPVDTALFSPDIPFYTDEAELMQQDFDVLCIATPNGLHERHACLALEKGHHILIEKPMALTAAACERIIGEARRRRLEVFCIMQNRYSFPSVWLKRLLDQGLLGRLYMLTVNCFWNRDERYYRRDSWRGTRDLDGGVLFTQFSHFIDSILWLFGDMTDITARFRNFSHTGYTAFEDSGTVQFILPDGGLGSLHFTTSVWKENLESSLTVIGEKGTVKISGQYMDEIRVCSIEGYTLPDYPAGTGSHNHCYVFANVADVLEGKARPDIQPEEAARVVAAIEKIYSENSRI